MKNKITLNELRKIIKIIIKESLENENNNITVLKTGTSKKINTRLRKKTFEEFFLKNQDYISIKEKIIDEVAKQTPGELLEQVGAGTQSVAYKINTDKGVRIIKYTKYNPSIGVGDNAQTDMDWFGSLIDLGDDKESHRLTVDKIGEIKVDNFKSYYVIMEPLHMFSDYLNKTGRGNKIKEYLINEVIKNLYDDFINNRRGSRENIIKHYIKRDFKDDLHLINRRSIDLETTHENTNYYITKLESAYTIKIKIGNEFKQSENDPSIIEIKNGTYVLKTVDQNNDVKKIVIIAVPDDKITIRYPGDYDVIFAYGDEENEQEGGTLLKDIRFGYKSYDDPNLTKDDKEKIDKERIKVSEYKRDKEKLMEIINSSDFNSIHHQGSLKNILSEKEINALLNGFEDYLKHSVKKDLDIHIDNVGIKQNDDWLTNPKFVIFDR